jgi:hypothetical protein
VALFLRVLEEVLGELPALVRVRVVKVVEMDAEGLEVLCVPLAVNLDELLGRLLLLLGLDFYGCAVLVGRADEDRVVMAQAAVPRVNIRREVGAPGVPYVERAVRVR